MLLSAVSSRVMAVGYSRSGSAVSWGSEFFKRPKCKTHTGQDLEGPLFAGKIHHVTTQETSSLVRTIYFNKGQQNYLGTSPPPLEPLQLDDLRMPRVPPDCATCIRFLAKAVTGGSE